MNPQRSAAQATGGRRLVVLPSILAAALAAGCKSDLSHQLLERELRYQEDQIYQLQDELAEKCSRLEHVATENASLRRQLGVSDADQPAPGRGRRTRASSALPAATVPPAIQVPDAAPLPAPRRVGPPVDLAPPTLEGVPPVPAASGGATPTSDTGDGLSLPPATASFDPAARPIAAAGSASRDDTETGLATPSFVTLSHAEPAGPARAVRLSINPATSAPIDPDGDGLAEGIALAVEPRDEAERLIWAGGDVTVTAFDAAAAAGSPPLASWTVAEADARARFRPTGRRRGLFLELPWQAVRPTGDHVRVAVHVTTPEGPIETEALVPAR
ncbi:MAG: hypothetical protein FJ284_00030 [Planctomycetes bacterium]|nr:hypothetical protein [Planctomycetota bacterium]